MGGKGILREGEEVREGMKSRKVLVSITLRTDIPMKWLRDKRRWQSLLDLCYHETKKPLYDDYYVGEVDVVKLK